MHPCYFDNTELFCKVNVFQSWTLRGNDANKPDRPLVNGQVALSDARRFASLLYATTLLVVPLVPSMISSFIVMLGLTVSAMYTKRPVRL